MKKTTFYCDRCGKEITGVVNSLATVRFNVNVDDYADDMDIERGADLCWDCYQVVDEAVLHLVNDVRKAPEPEPKPEPKPAKVRKPAKRKPLDLGKIGALTRAGWSVKKIAEELGVSENTIYNHMNEALEFLSNSEEKEVAENV